VRVLLDANALMLPAQFRIDVFDELQRLLGSFEPFILASVMQELEGLSRAGGKTGAAARCALVLAKQCKIIGDTREPSDTVDDQVVEYAVMNKCIVVTNDRRVRDILFAKGIGVISLRNQKKLELLQR
jgi:rRNA-processing protein FCF1